MKLEVKTEVPEMSFVAVYESDPEECVELPLEADFTLLLSTLTAQFPGATGMKYKPPNSKAYRGLRLENDRIHMPTDGFENLMFTVVFAKDNAKRKMVASNDEQETDESGGGASKLKRVADKQQCCDLIVLGLPYKMKEEELREHFEQFGEVVIAEIKTDAQGRSKGFGFIRFVDMAVQHKVLSQRHQIEGRWCDVRIPNSKGGGGSSNSNEPPLRKIFVGRITEDMTTEQVREYFSKFGTVSDVYCPKPFRAFMFVTFTEDNVARSLIGSDHVIDGHSVNVSPAVAKGQGTAAQMQQQQQQPNWGNDGWGMGGRDQQAAAAYAGYGGGYGADYSGSWGGSGYDSYGGGYGGYSSGGYSSGYGGGAGGAGSSRHHPYAPPAPAGGGGAGGAGPGAAAAGGSGNLAAGMGNLNLGVNPQVLATAQAALVYALQQNQQGGGGAASGGGQQQPQQPGGQQRPAQGGQMWPGKKDQPPQQQW